MIKRLLTILSFLLISGLVLAQSSVAKIKYEEAEEAYTKNDYQLAVSKLDEAETILKATNAKILYLRIMAQSKIIELQPAGHYTLLAGTKKLALQYLKNYENMADIEEKYRQIYRVSETLNRYPGTQEAFTAYTNQLRQAEQELLERPRKFLDSLCDYYKFRHGLSEEAFKTYNPEAAAIMVKKKKAPKQEDGSYTYVNAYVAGPGYITVKEGKVVSYDYAIKASGNKTDLETAFEYYRKILAANFKGKKIVENQYEDIKNFFVEMPDAGIKLHLSLIPDLRTVTLSFGTL